VRLRNRALALVGVALFAAILAACSDQPAGAVAATDAGAAPPTANAVTSSDSRTTQHLSSLPVEELSEEEATALLFMREEEKLAHDVYVELGDLWGLQVFENISRSESTHMDAVLQLLDRYGLDDPAGEPGVFTDGGLQALYDELIVQGSLSIADALVVGATIEETDIVDLQQRIAATDNEDIRLVFTNLLNGSYNHLRAFTR
jgi:hypothetical protein